MPLPDDLPPVLPYPSTDDKTVQAARVTVIVPAYNYGLYLPAAIESVLAQSVSDFHLLIVDDGSIDDTADVARDYAGKDSRIRYIYQKNAGLSAARNTGIRAARTRYVTFLDADDELTPAFLERCLASIDALPPDYALVACTSHRIDQEGRLLREKSHDTRGNRDVSCQDLILKNRFPANVLARRDVFAQGGDFDASLASSEDRDMWIRIARTHRIFQLAEPLVSIRTHATNMSRNSDRMRENMRKVLAKAFCQEGAGLAGFFFRLKVSSYFHFQNSWMRHEEGRRAGAIEDMVISLLLWPFFPHPGTLNEPILFRLRGLARFLLRPVNEDDSR